MIYQLCYICKIECELGDYETFEGKHYCISCFELEFETPYFFY